jgi:uncharacterized protein YfaS (alpha-2-macroglobulin family)
LFLASAKEKGYQVPSSLLNNYLSSERENANIWKPKSKESEDVQAFRLYALALNKSKSLTAMNQLKESGNLGRKALLYLSLAYQTIGQSSVSMKLLDRYLSSNAMGGSYFENDMTESAARLQLYLNLGLNDKANEEYQGLVTQLNRRMPVTTQGLALAMTALESKLEKLPAGSTISAQINIDGKQQAFKPKGNREAIKVPMNNAKFPEVMVVNKGNAPLHVLYSIKAKPLVGSEKEVSQGLNVTLSYYDVQGKPLDPTQIKQGTDFICEATVNLLDSRSSLENVALTTSFPSGWEIHPIHLFESALAKSSNYDYQDIRDTKVITYFSIEKAKPVKFKFLLNASYPGKFYMPATTCEAMYEPRIRSVKKGNWVCITKSNTQNAALLP